MSFIIANLKIFIQTFQSSTKSSNLLLCEEDHTAEDFIIFPITEYIYIYNIYIIYYIYSCSIRNWTLGRHQQLYLGFCEFFYLINFFDFQV